MKAHMIGHHHIDLIWLWTWEETVNVVRATWQSVLDRMDEYPDIRFIQTSAAAYKWIEEIDPAMFQAIARRVNEGRWVIVGGWWVEPDCNVPSGEAFVRQGLYGKRYFKEKFNVETDIGVNHDSFGHNWMLPQILRKMRISKYMFMRPNPRENPQVPADVFWWEAPDRSRVLTCRIYRYGTWGDTGEALLKAFSEERKYLNKGLNDILVYYGIGNHGGIQTKELIDSILDIKNSSADVDIEFSDPVDFFKAVEKSGMEFPVYRYDLQHHAQGCYSTIANIKKMNRENENLLCTAEKLSVIANHLAEKPYPEERLREGWEKVLFNQFHDILSGSSIESAYTDVIAWHGEARMKAREAVNSAAQSIGALIDTKSREGIPIVVWNPHGNPVSAPVELELDVTPENEANSAGMLVDQSGTMTPCQFEPGESYMGGGSRRRVIFLPTIPAMGYRTFWLAPGMLAQEPSPQTLAVHEDSLTVTMENTHLALVIGKEKGYVIRLVKKDGNTAVITSPAAVPVALEDSSDTWSHDVVAFKNEIGAFGNAEVNVMEQGPVRCRVRVTSTYNKSTLIQDFILYEGERQVEVRAAVDWHEKLTMLKMKFQVNVTNPRSFYSIPFGYIEREVNGHENPGGPYLAVEGVYAQGNAPAGLVLLNDCKYGFDVDGACMAMTVLRSPVYAHHEPYVLSNDIDYPYMDQGRHEFRYALMPFGGAWSPSESERASNLLNVPLLAFEDYRHKGHLPPEYSFCAIEPQNVILTALKRHEDSDNLIVRIHEADGVKIETMVSVPGLEKMWKGTLKPYEIKTLYIPKGEGDCYEMDMIEWDKWKEN